MNLFIYRLALLLSLAHALLLRIFVQAVEVCLEEVGHTVLPLLLSGAATRKVGFSGLDCKIVPIAIHLPHATHDIKRSGKMLLECQLSNGLAVRDINSKAELNTEQFCDSTFQLDQKNRQMNSETTRVSGCEVITNKGDNATANGGQWLLLLKWSSSNKFPSKQQPAACPIFSEGGRLSCHTFSSSCVVPRSTVW
jgi:hypothetical protein